MNTANCVKCKGRGFCGKKCPFLQKFYNINIKAKKDFFSASPPSIFVGRFNYPNVNVGVLSPFEHVEDASSYDNYFRWFSERWSINDITSIRSELVNSRVVGNVNKVNRIVELFQEVVMARKSVDLEVSLKKVPHARINFSDRSAPMGPSAEVERINLAGNVSVERDIEKVFYDTDLKAVSAVGMLYNKGVNELKLAQVLSGGILGMKKDRKLVPTRWSITAVDDILGKDLIEKVKGYDVIDNYKVFFSSRLGNRFCIILMPKVWSFELFECFQKGGLFVNGDYEGYFGRKEYASNTAGGYYASRLGVLEYLNSIIRQACAVIIREITHEYFLPVGVWQVRQNVRNAFNLKREFSSITDALNYAGLLFEFNIERVFNKSGLINNTQKSILEY